MNNVKCQSFFFISAVALVALLFSACSDNSSSAGEEPFDASVVCPENLRGTFTDARDGQVYKYTTIGNQVWMAENLNYDAQGSICQGRDTSKCELYGRLYSYVGHDPDRAIDTINWNFIDSVCPNGWHLPTLTEWKQLGTSVGGIETEIAASRLKSVSGWEKSKWGAGIDACAFSVLPGGGFSYESTSEGVAGAFLSSTSGFESLNYNISFDGIMGYGLGAGRYTIRCLKN